jgi:hypothetical protein
LGFMAVVSCALIDATFPSPYHNSTHPQGRQPQKDLPRKQEALLVYGKAALLIIFRVKPPESIEWHRVLVWTAPPSFTVVLDIDGNETIFATKTGDIITTKKIHVVILARIVATANRWYFAIRMFVIVAVAAMIVDLLTITLFKTLNVVMEVTA